MPKLVYHDSDGVEKVINLGADPVLIGRATECQIQTQDAMVSRRHARIIWDGSYWIEDLGSSNGVFVGSEKVQRAAIRPGDTVSCGSLVLKLLPDAAARVSQPELAPPPRVRKQTLPQAEPMKPPAAIHTDEAPAPQLDLVAELDREKKRNADLTLEVDQLRRMADELRNQVTAKGPNAKLADGVILLGDSLASLRASLRNANGEATLLKEPDEAAQGVREALKGAAEQLELARAQLRNLAKLMGL
jgi:pSer/pThr/pTyr-binding forkhead associated (FHA) protein